MLEDVLFVIHGQCEQSLDVFNSKGNLSGFFKPDPRILSIRYEYGTAIK
jgi:hypothetical protein